MRPLSESWLADAMIVFLGLVGMLLTLYGLYWAASTLFHAWTPF